MSPFKVATEEGDERFSIGKITAIALSAIGLYRTVAIVFGLGLPPMDLEEKVTALAASLGPVIALLGGALWGIRRALK